MSCDKTGPRQPRNLISRTTVLILASLLIWVGAGRELPSNQNAFYLLLGLVGIIAYLGLERAAFRRLQLEHSNTQLLYRLEQRLHAQLESSDEAPLQLDADTSAEAARAGRMLAPANVAQSSDGRADRRPQKSVGNADVLRIPVAHTGKLPSSDRGCTSPTAHAHPA